VSVPSPIRAEPPDHHSPRVLTFPASVGMIQAFHLWEVLYDES